MKPLTEYSIDELDQLRPGEAARDQVEEQLRAMIEAGKPLADFHPAWLKLLPYAALLLLRRRAYLAHVETMPVPDRLKRWVPKMQRRFGETVTVWKNEDLPWLAALLVALYGEDPMQWPPVFTSADVERAEGWHSGRSSRNGKASKPAGVRYLDEDNADAGFVASLIPAITAIGGGLFAAPIGGAVVAVLAMLSLFSLMTALTNHWENELIDHLFRGRSYTAPSDHYFALYTAAPGETGGGTEVSGGSYARVQVTADFNNFLGTGGETTATDSTGTGGQTSNRAAIAFPSPTANWGVASHMAVLDASSSGNFRTYAALTASKTINNGDSAPTFAIGAFTFTLA